MPYHNKELGAVSHKKLCSNSLGRFPPQRAHSPHPVWLINKRLVSSPLRSQIAGALRKRHSSAY